MSLLDKICQALINMIRKKDSTTHVWTNASPSSGFGAQTLKIDLSNADFVDMDIDIAGNGRGRVQRFKVGEKGMITSNNDNTSYTNYCYTRLLEVTTTGITFGDGYFNSTKTDKYTKPKSIWKIKLGGYFVTFFRHLQGGVVYA